MDEAVRLAVDGGKVIEDSQEFAAANGFAHAELVGLCKSLATGGFITTEATSRRARRPPRTHTRGAGGRSASAAHPARAGSRCSSPRRASWS